MQLQDPTLFTQAAYIDGQWINAVNNATIRVINPATGDRIGYVPRLGASETNQAICAATTSWQNWRATTAQYRSDLLYRLYEAILTAKTDLAHIITTEQGKPLREAEGEVIYAASFIRWFAEEARRVYGDIISASQSDKRLLVLKQPIGVCAAITPWNFPLAMLARKLGPALAAGCTLIIKPAPETPFSALALAVLAERVGIPSSIIQVLTGEAPEIAQILMQDTSVRKISFTGSTAVGRLLMQQSAQTIKKISLELGGNAPFIVFEDADIDAAVQGAITAKFRNNGQTCVCANRIFVHNTIYDKFAKLLSEHITNLRVGNGMDTKTDLGPLIHEKAVQKVQKHLHNALSQGASLLIGGHRLAGNFFEPTILTNVTSSMEIACEETFGPIAPLIRFQDEEAVLHMANQTEYGLASYFYTQDLKRSWRVAERLEYGIVGVNTGLISTVEAPFGGIKQSGLGREGSKYGMDDYLELKYVCIQL